MGLLCELLIVGISNFESESIASLFQLSARYSGRLSLVYFLAPWWFFIGFANTCSLETIRKPLKAFAILHIIHFGFLAMNIYLNSIPIVPVKLLGGTLAYLMIVLLPFLRQSFTARNWVLPIYFFYVSIVMLVTYLSRIKGDFEGSLPSPVHYIAFTVLVVSMIVFLVRVRKSFNKKSSH